MGDGLEYVGWKNKGMDWRGRCGKRNWPEEESEEESAGRCGKKNTQSDGGKRIERSVDSQKWLSFFGDI